MSSRSGGRLPPPQGPWPPPPPHGPWPPPPPDWFFHGISETPVALSLMTLADSRGRLSRTASQQRPKSLLKGGLRRIASVAASWRPRTYQQPDGEFKHGRGKRGRRAGRP